ncbi:MAG TPA: DUF6636 domain-containing protein [Solirubrobacteraceae bacterium]|nr:DUF6636 domain-containing protein [Solirubrobacteraceae bacterium]
MPARLITAIVVVVAAVAPSAAAADSLVGFASPSRNIGCYMDRAQVRCDIRNRSFTPPQRPRSCPLDYGQGLIVTGRGRGRYVCAGDTALDGQRALPYGRSISRGPFRCTSLTSGMRCINVRTGHGFALSRQRAVLF